MGLLTKPWRKLTDYLRQPGLAECNCRTRNAPLNDVFVPGQDTLSYKPTPHSSSSELQQTSRETIRLLTSSEVVAMCTASPAKYWAFQETPLKLKHFDL